MNTPTRLASAPGTPSRSVISLWPLAAGFVTAVVHLLTVSRGAYPGPSAAYTAAVAHLVPESLPTHPVWSLLMGWAAHAPLLSLTLRLNVLTALCAACAVGLLGMLMERWLFEAAREPVDGTAEPMRPEDEDAATELRESPGGAPAPNTVSVACNRCAAVSARLGGWVAVLAFAFSVPFWSTATRLHFQPFDVLLLLLTVCAVRAHAAQQSLARALMVAMLCGLGCVESAIFVPLGPLFFLMLLRNRLRVEMPWAGQMFAGLIAAAISAAAALLLTWSVRIAAVGSDVPVWPVFVGMARSHLAILRQALPASGWIWILVLAFVPSLVMILAGKRAFSERSFSMVGMHVAMTVAVAVCVFNAPISPWGLARNTGYFPVIAYLAVAVATGYLVAYWRMLRAPQDVPDDSSLARARGLSPVWCVRLGTCFSWTLSVAVVLAAALNLGAADGRKGDFADVLARDVIGRLGTRTWVVSNGMLDNHLLILAREQHRELRLVSLADGVDEVRQRRLRAMIDAEPAFAARRVRLYNAAALGPMAFAQEWLADDPAAEARLLIVGVPELWTMAGYRPVPSGFAFDGVRDLASLRNADLLGPNQAYWQSMSKVLASGDSLPPGPARFRAVLRRQAGLSANNLGVVLEDLARPDEAYEAYEAACRIDPRNLSALLNQQALALGGTRADTRLKIEGRLRIRLKQEKQLPPIPVIVRSYGDIRQPKVLSVHGLAWAETGQPELARAELKRALALAPTNTSLNYQLAGLAMRQDKADEGEQAYRAILAAKPNDAVALVGLASAALARGRHDDARAWLARARQAGAPESALAIPTAALLAASGRTDEALASLRILTDGNAGNLEAWSLLADLLLRQKNVDEVEQRVLPAMVKATGKSGDHVLIHLVRANMLRAKRPVDFAAVRTSLLLAMKLRPDLVAIREDLLALDFACGDQAARERDASDVLRVSPDHAFANYLLATVLLDRGELLRAEDLFRRSLAAHPTAVAHNDLAETQRRLRQFTAAEQSVRAALALDDKSYAAWDTLGCVLLDLGRLDEAARAVEQSLVLRDTDPRIHLSLARIRRAQGRPDEVSEILKRPVLRPENLPPDLQREIASLSGPYKRPGL